MINLNNYLKINNKAINSNAKLVAVSKTKPFEAIEELYQQGHRNFGENRVQELVEKYEVLPKDIQWHLIGSLQRNKVKYIASFVALIHSVDNFKLLNEINKQAQKHQRVIDCLLQFHIAEESTKAGMQLEDAVQLLAGKSIKALNNVRIVGVMGMATFTDNETQIRNEFRHLKKIFDELKHNFFSQEAYFEHLSMGMSGDYELALKEGSTLIRVGSLLFGAR